MIVIGYKDNNIILKLDYSDIDDVKQMLDSKGYKYSFGNTSVPAIFLGTDCVHKLNNDLMPFKNRLEIHPSFTDWKALSLKAPVLIKCGVVTSKIYKGGYEIPHKQIEDVCKYFFTPAVRQQRYKDKKWDGYIHLYKRWLHEFPTGLVSDVCEVLKKSNIPYNVEYTYEQRPQRQFDWEVNDGITPDPDQIEAIDACVHGLRGICKAPTGFGKTAVLAKRLTSQFGVPTLFIGNKKTLLDDAAEAFRDGVKGLNVEDVIEIKDGWFGETKITPSSTYESIKPLKAPIIVATIQSLHARLKDERTRPYLIEWLHNICKFVMLDESQAFGTAVFDEVFNEIYAPLRIFLSATPRRTDGATLKLFGGSGPVLFFSTAEEQIEKGRLCDLDIQYRIFNHNAFNDNDADLEYAAEYKYRIVENEERNKEIIKSVFEMLEEERHVLLLVQIIDHGHILKNMLIETGLNPEDVRFIWGDTKDKIRTQAIDDFRKGKFKVFIGSTIADAGLNLPIVSSVILAQGGNSDITLIQRIGRGARNCDYEKVLGYIPKFLQESNGKKISKIIDIMDCNVKFFNKQSRNRYHNAIEEFGKNRVHIVGDKSVFNIQKKRTTANTVNVDQYSAQFEMLKQFSE